MKFLKDIKDYKLQLINEAFTISKKIINPYIENYYDKYDSFSEEIKNIVNKYIFKNMIESSIIKKNTRDGVLNKEEFNKEIKDTVNSKSPEELKNYIKSTNKELIEKSISEMIYINILKTLSIRKRKDDILCDINPTTANILIPYFIDFYINKSSSKEDLENIYKKLSALDFDPKYFEFLKDFNKFKDISYYGFNELYGTIISEFNKEYNKYSFKVKDSGKVITYSLLDYIGKEDKENYPSWWPFEKGPLKPPSKDYYLSEFIKGLDIFISNESLNNDDIHIISEKITDKLGIIDKLFKISRFVKLMPIFDNKNPQNGLLGVEVNLKSLFYNVDSNELKEKIANVSEINFRKGNPNKDKIITKKSMKYRDISKILDSAEDELGSIIPTTSDSTLEEIEEINLKLGKNDGVEILWISDDEEKLIVQVNSHPANYILNGEGTKYKDQQRSSHCIAYKSNSNWITYVGDKPRLQFYIYDFSPESRQSNKWTIGITLGLDKMLISGACQDSKNVGISKPELNRFFDQENIPFFEILDKVDPKDEGTIYEGKTLLEKNIFIKNKRVEANKKFRQGDLTISEIEEVLKEGADINAYEGSLIKKALEENDLEKIKFILSKGGTIFYLKSKISDLVKDKNYNMLKFLLDNGIDLSDYKFNEYSFSDFNVFTLLINNVKDSINIDEKSFSKITDIRILLYFINKKIYIDSSLISKDFLLNNRDNYPSIKLLFDNNFIDNNSKLSTNNSNVYNLFILNGSPLNYFHYNFLYQKTRSYIKDLSGSEKTNLDNILNTYLSETIVYRKSCEECNGYSFVNYKVCNSCKGTGLSDQKNTYKSFLDKKMHLYSADCYEKLFGKGDNDLVNKFMDVLIKLKSSSFYIDIELFEGFFEELIETDEEYIINHKDKLINLINLVENELDGDLLERLKDKIK